MRMVFYSLCLLVIGGLAWIRLAPSDPAHWHADPKVTADQDLANGVRRRIPATSDSFQDLHQLILETPRTDVLIGSPDEGKVTYVTRSLWFGFPDYTTIKANGDVLELWARQRFGMEDLGVNKARVDGWLETLQAEENSN